MFNNGTIEGVSINPLARHTDPRGWLVEAFRQDGLSPENHPVMGYISATEAGMVRGPHEHIEQTDLFAFIGPSNFKVYMWDNRKNSPTYRNRLVIVAGEDDPRSLLIPPGVVHAYKNVGAVRGIVTNFPNRLFAGKDKREKVDEIRYENIPDTEYILD